ncbi:hypothetical protein HIM_08857 [Hirsutella minnesotensis 3608]|uniref:ATP-dependent DNA ligase family profile domain-containing protein n=1 Tax=Hirsutella minnesotensis 3608 TaxID=1043627 RepID=A0A0F7ZY33_9HYPO|nr:hypothetical protein HIM_08857 [Hirsutella minnesotensis 3608]
MPLPFTLVCDLLEECQRLHRSRKSNKQAIVNWFNRHRGCIDAHDTDISALLSTLLPEKRTDRVFCIQATRLEKIIGRALMLGSSRVAELTRYRQPGLGIDLADCVERVLTTTPNPITDQSDQVTVEEIDQILHSLASQIRWSSPAIRSQATPKESGLDDLGTMYRCLGAVEAKWLTRLILKDFRPLILDSNLVYGCCHPILPLILKIYDDFTTAIRVVREVKGKLLPNSVRGPRVTRSALLSLKPRLGIKVGRQNWLKARSIKHCVDLSHGRMTVEAKVDGEYCQIHVDATRHSNRIQIFSKSGKDSTEDRQGLHEAIEHSLHFGSSNSKIRTNCILEGELVVYSEVENKILPFHRIRNHVARRGLFLNTEDDTPPSPDEKLMIVYYDILLLDERSLLDVRHSERLKLLTQVVNPVKGRAALIAWQVIDIGHTLAVSELRKAFANVIVQKGEGLVLKPDEPYFDFHVNSKPFGGRCIKLKKEYIGNFGDVGDFAVVGAGFDASKTKTYNIPELRWTHFYLGCLNNKEQVTRWSATPDFTVVSVVELNETQLTTLLKFCNPLPVSLSENAATRLKIPKGVENGPPLTVAFGNPPVFDLRCFSFDKPGNVGFWTLRFPIVSKIHFDRDFSETIDFENFQEIANKSISAPELEDSQENLAWISRLESADPRGFAVDTVSQLTATTMQTPSPIKSTQSSSGRETVSPGVASKNLQTCMQVDKGGSVDQGAKVFSAASLSLMAPPLLLPRPEPSPLKLLDGSPRKRPASPRLTSSQPPKRRRSSLSEALEILPPQNSPRTPLVDVDSNSIPPQTVSSSARSHKATKSRTSDKENPIKAAKGTTVDIEARERQRADITPPEITVTTVTDVSNDRPILLRANRAQTVTSRNSVADSRGSEDAPLESDLSCVYASSACWLAARTILVSSASLLDMSEPVECLKAHGVLQHAATIDEWLERCKSGCNHTQDAKADHPKILLIDTMGDTCQTKKLLGCVQKTKQELSCRQHDLISVYDWRVLRHITVLEDESISSKYYDGFHDPWRRWYCGII